MPEDIGHIGHALPKLKIWKSDTGVVEILLDKSKPTNPALCFWTPTDGMLYGALGDLNHPQATKGRVAYGGKTYAILRTKDNPVPSGGRNISQDEVYKGTVTIPAGVTKVRISWVQITLQGISTGTPRVIKKEGTSIINITGDSTYTIYGIDNEIKNDALISITPIRIEWSADINNAGTYDSIGADEFLVKK